MNDNSMNKRNLSIGGQHLTFTGQCRTGNTWRLRQYNYINYLKKT